MFFEFAWNAALVVFSYLAWRHVRRCIAHNEQLMDRLLESASHHEEISRDMKRESEALGKKVDTLRHLIDMTKARVDRLSEIAEVLRQNPDVAAEEENQEARKKAIEDERQGEELVDDAVNRFVRGV